MAADSHSVIGDGVLVDSSFSELYDVTFKFNEYSLNGTTTGNGDGDFGKNSYIYGFLYFPIEGTIVDARGNLDFNMYRVRYADFSAVTLNCTDSNLSFSSIGKTYLAVAPYDGIRTINDFVFMHVWQTDSDSVLVDRDLANIWQLYAVCPVRISTMNDAYRIKPSSFNVTYSGSISSDMYKDLSKKDVKSDDVNKVNDSVEKGNKLQEEANKTSKGILGKISDFFGSFFENIINALKSLFIPEDGYFSDFFNRLNDLFSEKLGFLYAPIDLFVSFLNAIQNASVGSSPGLVFPEIKWEDTVLVEETAVNFDLVNEKMPQLQERIYFVTNIIMVGAVIVLLERKIDEVMHK